MFKLIIKKKDFTLKGLKDDCKILECANMKEIDFNKTKVVYLYIGEDFKAIKVNNFIEIKVAGDKLVNAKMYKNKDNNNEYIFLEILSKHPFSGKSYGYKYVYILDNKASGNFERYAFFGDKSCVDYEEFGYYSAKTLNEPEDYVYSLGNPSLLPRIIKTM